MKSRTVELNNGGTALKVKIDYWFPLEEFVQRIWHQMAAYGAEMPVTRDECFALAVLDVQRCCFGWGQADEDVPDRVRMAVGILFPELKSAYSRWKPVPLEEK